MEIETHPRAVRQSSISSVLSSQSMSDESLGHSQDYLCASEPKERRQRGGGRGEELNGREKSGGSEEMVFSVFETVDV